MSNLKEQEEKLRLYLQSVENEINKFEKLKETFAQKRESIRAEMQAHDFSLAPVKIQCSETEDLLAEIDSHLTELYKLKNYLSVKIKRVVEEEELLESLTKKFGETIGIDQKDQGFEIIVSDKAASEAFNELKNSRNKTANLKNTIRAMGESSAEEN